MAEPVLVDLYCEDHGHERFAKALLSRLASESVVALEFRSQSSRGGHGKALSEFKAWQQAVRSGFYDRRPALLVIMIDANRRGWHAMRGDIERSVDPALFPFVVIGCPDPHVERWYMADPQSFAEAIGRPPPPDPGTRERHVYKRLLREAIESAGQPILTDPTEYADDIVTVMDLFRAEQQQPSLGGFVTDLRAAFRRLAESSELNQG